jgi:UDP-N-acetylmuramate dehydrogenase
MENINKLLPGVRKNVSLKNYTTFRIGGRAKYFFVVKTKEDLISAILVAKKIKLPFFVLGGGSNLLVSDKGFNGFVIKILNTKYQILKNKITAEAGITLGKLVNASAGAGLTGMEWAAGIPGTVGGAVFGNAGWPSNKKNISSVIEWVEVFNTKDLKTKILKNKNCKFGYRDSVFKHKKNLIILSTCLRLKKWKKEKIKKAILEILKKRKKKIPFGFSAGSVFKNQRGSSAGLLIEKCGLKGKMIGGAKISEKHANFIINFKNAKAKDIKNLINLAKNKVKNKFGVKLEEEIQIF